MNEVQRQNAAMIEFKRDDLKKVISRAVHDAGSAETLTREVLAIVRDIESAAFSAGWEAYGENLRQRRESEE